MGDRQGKKQALIARAEYLRERLGLVNGLAPAPCELRAEIELDCVDSYRFMDCPRYEDCIDVARLAFWEAMTCRACPVYRKYGVDKTIPKLRTVEHEAKKA